METDRGRDKQDWPVLRSTAENLLAIRLCLEVLEQQRKAASSRNPILLVVPFDETYIVETNSTSHLPSVTPALY